MPRIEVTLVLHATERTYTDLSENLWPRVRGAAKSTSGKFSILMGRYCTSENAKSPPGDDKVSSESSKGKCFQIVVKVTTGFHLRPLMMPLLTNLMKYSIYCWILD